MKEILEAIELDDKEKLIRDLSIEGKREKLFNFLNTYQQHVLRNLTEKIRKNQ